MKLFTDELALELTRKLLQNDKDIKDELQRKIDAISNGTGGGTSPIITIARTPDDDGVIITVTDLNGTNSVIVNDGINGKNAQIAKIEPIVDGNRITFSYYDDDDNYQTLAMEVMNGEKGTSVANARIDNGNELVLILSDDSEINAGKITINSDNLSLDNYYTAQQIDEKFNTFKIELDELLPEKIKENVTTISSEEIDNLF